MDELDFVDQIDLAQQHCADQAVEITAGDQTKLAVLHDLFPCGLVMDALKAEPSITAAGQVN